MGTEGTHPWVQGFPLTTPIEGGPSIPLQIDFSYADLKYPPATGTPELLVALRDYYNHFYKANISTDNIAIFAGGRPGIFATLMFLQQNVRILVEETEYTPYWDALRLLKREYSIVPSNVENNFRPSVDDYRKADSNGQPTFILKSNPCNPTGVSWRGEQLEALVKFCLQEGRGGLFDEAYEFFQENPESALQYVTDIDQSNIFIVSAATKGLQAPGLRVGWVISSRQNIELFRNFSSIAMGGVARPSQICVSKLLTLERVDCARKAIAKFYGSQRDRYAVELRRLGFELFTGDGGFYHWARLPNSLTADEFNKRLFLHHAAILPGTLCDMFRRGSNGPHDHFIRFSFGPLSPDSFENDIHILEQCVGPN